MKYLIYCLLAFSTCIFAEKVTYPFTTDRIDVVIPCSPDDVSTLDLCIEGVRKYGKNIGRVIVVSPRQLTDKAEWFDEKAFPFNKAAISLAIFNDDDKATEYLKGTNRLGWIYQQLMKLYVFSVLPDISPNVLVLDADTLFLNSVDFITPKGEPFLTPGGENMEPYFAHMKRLIPWLKRETDYSGIAHHMLLQKPVIDDLFSIIETEHKMPAWQALCSCIQELYWACMSEYEIYFNFILARTDQAHIRPLNWHNCEYLKSIEDYREQGCHYVSCHGWMRKD